MSEIRDKIVGLKDYMDSRIIGQKDLVKKMIITLLAEGAGRRCAGAGQNQGDQNAGRLHFCQL